MVSESIKQLHSEVLYSQVRVKTAKSGGSGTIIRSKEKSTYVLTCWHVVEEALTVRKDWDSRLGKERKREFRQLVKVEFFDWENVPHGNRPLNYSADAEVVAYDKDHDLALLKLRTLKSVPYVAKVMGKPNFEELSIGSAVVACGAALLHDPVLTTGIITHQGDEIDYKDYWMSNAQIIFGNSGGAMFADTSRGYEFIGVPSRIDVAGWGTPITHLGYFSPITRIYEFLTEQIFGFLLPGSEETEESCEKKRKEEQERDDRKLKLEAEAGE